MPSNKTTAIFFVLLRRDLILGYRNRGELINPLLFFLIIVTLFAIAVGPDKEILMRLSVAIIWVTAVLASSLSVDAMFRSDFDDGSLEQIYLSPHSRIVMIAARIFSHWLLSGAPLILCALLLGVFLYLPADGMGIMLITLVLGTPVLSLVGAVASALTVGLRGSGMLQALLILPLYIPLLIYSVAAVSNSMQGLPVHGELYFIGAILILMLTLAPFAVDFSLKVRLG